MLRVAIFDLDETLMRLPVDWESVKKEVIEYGRREGVAFDDNAHIIPLSSAISNTPERKRVVDEIWRRHELETLEKKGVERYPEAEKFVKSLYEKGVRLAIASNNCHITIEKALELAEIREFFEMVVGRDDVVNTKPAPDMLLKIAEKYKVEKKEMVFYGDSENDRKAGNAASIKTIIVKPSAPFPDV